MNALADIQSIRTRADPLEVLDARAWARAHLYAAGEYQSLHEAVDPLQQWAIDSGLLERIGQDAIQQILVHAFERVQRSFAAACGCADAEASAARQCSRESLAQSTRAAAAYLARTSSERLETWLLDHSPSERAAIVSYLEQEQDRS